MSAEIAIYNALKGLVGSRVYPDVAPSGSALPRIVFQQVGGQSLVYVEGVLPDRENGRFQIACWATTRLAAAGLAKQTEEIMVALPGVQAVPIGARVSVYEDDTMLFGTRQDFSVWSDR